MSKFTIISLLESVLGKGRNTTSDNIAFHCPFCNHQKPKLEVNIGNQHWHCWVCNVSGRKIPLLFRKLNASREKIAQAVKEFEQVEYRPNKTTTDTPVIELPKEYQPLWVMDKANPEYRNAVRYLLNRGITIHDILKYRIGYCSVGPYSGKIIIPSYDANGSLNYFVGRAYYESDTMKHKNPKVSKDIIGLELHINWDMPIILVEGVFDAIAIKRNAIPLFGKTISNTLKKRIVERKVKTIYICLDLDARKQALETAEYFMSNGIDVYFVELTGKDPSDMGFIETKQVLDSTCRFSEQQLMHEKILCAL